MENGSTSKELPPSPRIETNFYGYPHPKDHNVAYKANKAPQNPPMRGAMLKVSASVLPKVPGLPKFFYKNVGWTALQRVKGIEDIDGRYDPTVIPIVKSEPTTIAYTEATSLKRIPATDASGRFYSVLDYHEAYKSGKTNPTEIIEALLPLIRRDVQQRSPHSTAWLDTKVDIVKAAAAASTERWAQGKPLGVLDGIPVGVKDEADLKGYKKCMGSNVDFTNPLDITSWSVQQWEKEGAIVLGKTNMHEIGMDTSNCNPHFGTPLNPYNSEYYPGGSSGGSASAVSCGIIPFALGCDGGGSIRLPCSWCGLYGLKPSHGRVSTRPYCTPAKSTSVAGPMAANMADLEVAYRVMARPDPEEASSCLFPDSAKRDITPTKRLGIFKPWFDRADPEVRKVCQKAIDHFTEKMGYVVEDISLPHVHEGQLAHTLTIVNEASVALKGFKRFTPANNILLTVAQQANVKDFLAAQRMRALLMEHLAYLFWQFPDLVIVTPTTPNAGWTKHPADSKFGMSDGNQSMRNIEYVWLANFCGNPSITFPVGYVDPVKGEGKVPVGLMATGNWGAEDALIEMGYDGETYLNEVYEGGRLRPKEWVDVMQLTVAPPPVEKDGKVETTQDGKKLEEKAEEKAAENVAGEEEDKEGTKEPDVKDEGGKEGAKKEEGKKELKETKT